MVWYGPCVPCCYHYERDEVQWDGFSWGTFSKASAFFMLLLLLL